MRILILNQSFYPDVVATAQQAGDFASALASRGHEVLVIASRRAYDDARTRFSRRQRWRGVRIERIRCTGFGKGAKWRRAADFATFLLSCALRLIFTPRQDVVVAMTSPPLVSFLASLFVKLKGGSLVLWMMDLNPDEAVAAGWLREGSRTHRVLNRLLLYALRTAERIVVLDRFMKARIEGKQVPAEKIEIVPPWPHEHVRYHESGRSEFRRTHGLNGEFVVMYSGNHSPCHPLDPLLEAARELSGEPEYAFCFIGGGSEFAKVRRFAVENGLRNILCLPYQPFERLAESLSAADLHVVVLGEPFVGIVHPSKIYNILTLGIPFLYIGPGSSHVTDMLPEGAVGRWSFLARDAAGVAGQIRLARRSAEPQTASQLALATRFSQQRLVARMISTIEEAARAPRLTQTCLDVGRACEKPPPAGAAAE